MNLLEEIIESATDDSKSVSVVLRKCLQLAYRLDNETLKTWVEQELNGYVADSELPEYRALRVGAVGHFSGYFGSAIKNAPIPASILDREHRGFAETVRLRQAVKAYEPLAEKEGATIRWPADLIMYYQRREIYSDMVLADAWQPIPSPSLHEVLDCVRNKALTLALEIRKELGNSKDFANLNSNRVETTITNIIYGTGTVQVNSASPGASNSSVSLSGEERLKMALSDVGLKDDHVQSLAEALTQDKQGFGPKVSQWITKSAKFVVIGGVKLDIETSKPVLTELIKKHLGLA